MLLFLTFHSSAAAGVQRKTIPGGSHEHSNNVCYISLQVCVLLKPENTKESSLKKKKKREMQVIFRSLFVFRHQYRNAVHVGQVHVL